MGRDRKPGDDRIEGSPWGGELARNGQAIGKQLASNWRETGEELGGELGGELGRELGNFLEKIVNGCQKSRGGKRLD